MTTIEAFEQLKERFPESKIETWDYCESFHETLSNNPRVFCVVIDGVRGRGDSLEACICNAIAQIPTPEKKAESLKKQADELATRAAELTRQAEKLLQE